MRILTNSLNPFMTATLARMQALPSVKRLANFAGTSTNTGKNANDIKIKNAPKQNKIEKFFQFSAASCTSYILFVKPFSVFVELLIPLFKLFLILPMALANSPLFSSG